MYYPKVVNVTISEETPYSNPEFAEIELITNYSPYTSEYISPVENDDVVRLQVSCRMSPKEKYVYVDLFEGRVETVSSTFSTKNNTTLSCKGHIDAATKYLIQEGKTWAGTVEARTILAYFVNSSIPRLTWDDQLPYVDASSVNFIDTDSAYATTVDQTYLSTVFKDLEEQSGYTYQIGTKAVYTDGGLLSDVHLTWLPVSETVTNKYKCIEGTSRFLGSTFSTSIENQATQYIIKGDTPSGGTQYSGTARDEDAILQYGLKTDVDVYTQLGSDATCKSIAEGVLPVKIGNEISGVITMVGTPEAHKGDIVYVKSVSTELNRAIVEGEMDVSRVRSYITPSSYKTIIEVGGIVENVYDRIKNIKTISVTTKTNQVT